jgi:hypothetical protein
MMMAVEGPFLAAIIARAGDSAVNLAAYGVAFAFAILIESPVIMLMSASTALVEDGASYRRLRNFARALNGGSTLVLLLVLIPPIHQTIMGSLIGLPQEVVQRIYVALWLLLPWPAAIGYRRFLHGVLIRSGRTRLVAMGTVLRLIGLGSTALLLFRFTDLPGAWVGAAALSAGVVTDALAARWMAAGVLRGLLQDATADGAGGRGGYGEVLRFYYPLAVTSFLGLAVHPLLTFLMGRSPAPIESLAVFPVVHGLSFLFRAVGFSFQEVVIALAGRRLENLAVLARFGAALGLISSGALALLAFTPLVHFWYETVSGLTPELAALAVVPTRVSALLPALAVLLAFQHGLLVRSRRTRAITAATAIEVVGIGSLFTLFAWGMGTAGVTAATLALVGGRLAGNVYLMAEVRRVARGA